MDVRELAILDFIRSFTEAHGEPPTVTDVEAEFDWLTTETAADWVLAAMRSRLHGMAAWDAVNRRRIA